MTLIYHDTWLISLRKVLVFLSIDAVASQDELHVTASGVFIYRDKVVLIPRASDVEVVGAVPYVWKESSKSGNMRAVLLPCLSRENPGIQHSVKDNR